MRWPGWIAAVVISLAGCSGAPFPTVAPPVTFLLTTPSVMAVAKATVGVPRVPVFPTLTPSAIIAAPPSPYDPEVLTPVTLAFGNRIPSPIPGLIAPGASPAPTNASKSAPAIVPLDSPAKVVITPPPGANQPTSIFDPDRIIAGQSPISISSVLPSPTRLVPTNGTKTPSPAATITPLILPSGALSWEKARSVTGLSATLCGPVIGAHYAKDSRGAPTFLNIGRPYPDPSRLTVVIWGENRRAFATPPETAYAGKTVCVNGAVQEYRGAIEIEVSAPAQIGIR
jgi:hypothetical protein